MNFIDMSRKRDAAGVRLWGTRRRVLLASAAVLLLGTATALTVFVAQRTPQPVAVAAAAPEVLTGGLARPARAEPDSAAQLLAAVSALRPDPVLVRDEPAAFTAPLPEATPRPAAAPAQSVVAMSAMAAQTAAAPQPQNTLALALPAPVSGVLLPVTDVPMPVSVAVLVPDAATPRPALRPVSVAQRAAPAGPTPPQPRPSALASATAPVPPVPRPGAVAAGLALADLALADLALADLALAGPSLADLAPQPRPSRDIQTASMPVARPLPTIELTEARALIAAAAPEASPRPSTRPAKILLAAVAARQAAGAGAAITPERVVQREPVASAPNSDLDAASVRTAEAANCSSQLARGIPRRSGRAASGSEFGAALGNVSGTQRDQMVVREVLSGNVPQFLRRLIPVTLTGTASSGRPVAITVCVTPDYVSVGSDDDFLRLPMGLPEAAQIADQFGFMLPTTRIVDAVYANAGVRLAPRPMQAGPQMTSTSYLRQHNATIESQTSAAGLHNGTLVAGIKKDLVLTNALRNARGQVAIYGWHQTNGRPIQPLTTVHGQHYSDYSHGVRLVSQTAYLNGRAVALADLLEDRVYSQIISSEGPIAAPRTLLASLYTH